MGRIFKDLIDISGNFFITGTDTDVGKTYFSAIMLRYTEGQYYKPVQTGAKDSDAVKSFTLLSQEHFLEETYFFEDPVSPNIAAERSNTVIRLDEIFLPNCGKIRLIAEGAGGLYTPLGNGFFMIDIIKKFGFPAIVVSMDKLGCINHTILTVNELRKSGVDVLFIVMNNYDPGSYNLKVLRDILKIPVLGIPKFKYFPDKKQVEEIFNVEL